MASNRKRTMTVDIVVEDKKARQNLGNIDKSTQKTADQFGRTGKAIKTAMGVVATAAIVDFGKEMAAHGARMEAIERRTDTVFGGSAGVIRDWADDVNEAFGMSENGVLNLASSFGDLLVPMGFTRAETAELTKETLEAANALSEWTGGQVTTEQAAEAVSKAMLGEREQLKSLGISIMEADVQQRLLEKGQKDLTGTALAQAKAIATQELIFEKSADALTAYGDAAGSALREQKNLASTVAELKDELAQRLLPALSAAVGALGDGAEGVKVIVEWFDNLPGPLKAAAAAIGGFTVALKAIYANPVLAGLALVAAVVVEIGGNAKQSESDIAGFTEAIEETGEAGKDAAVEVLKARDATGEMEVAAAKAGVTLDDMARAIVGETGALEEVERALDEATRAGAINRVEATAMKGIIDQLSVSLDTARTNHDLVAEANRNAAEAEDRHESQLGELNDKLQISATRTDEFTEATARSSDEIRKQIDPLFALRDATAKYDDALGEVLRLQGDGKRGTDEYRDAIAKLIQKQADLNFYSDQFDAAADPSIEALFELARQAGLSEDEIRDLIAAIKDLNNTPIGTGGMGGPGDPGIPIVPPGGGPIFLDKGGFVPGPVGAPVPATVHGGELVLNPAQQKAIFGSARTSQPSIVVQAGALVTEDQLEELIARIMARYGLRNGRF